LTKVSCETILLSVETSCELCADPVCPFGWIAARRPHPMSLWGLTEIRRGEDRPLQRV